MVNIPSKRALFLGRVGGIGGSHEGFMKDYPIILLQKWVPKHSYTVILGGEITPPI